MSEFHHTDLTLLTGSEYARREKIAALIRGEELLQQIKPSRAAMRDRVLAFLGTVLVCLGRRMQGHSVLVLTRSSGTN